ncbi:MAG: hypothetical protein ACRCU2_00030 [Planktothrix sp.]
MLFSEIKDSIGIENYIGFKQVSGAKLSGIIIIVFAVNLLVAMSVSNALFAIMNFFAIVITILGNYVAALVTPSIDTTLKKQLPWAIVTPKNQHNLLNPENRIRTLKTLEKIKKYNIYEKKHMKNINRSFDTLIQVGCLGIEQTENIGQDSLKPIIDCLMQLNTSSIIPEIKKDFLYTLIKICNSQENICEAQIIYKALDSGIPLPVDELSNIFQGWVQEIEIIKSDDWNQDENNFKAVLSNKYKLFDFYVKCLQKLVKKWKNLSESSVQSTSLENLKYQIFQLAWGNNGIMMMFPRIFFAFQKIDQEQKQQEYFQNFSEPVFQTLSAIYFDLDQFSDKSSKQVVFNALPKILAIYSKSYAKSYGNPDVRKELQFLTEILKGQLEDSQSK